MRTAILTNSKNIPTVNIFIKYYTDYSFGTFCGIRNIRTPKVIIKLCRTNIEDNVPT